MTAVRSRYTILTTLLCCAAFALPATVVAKDYMVEVILFENTATRDYPGANRLFVPRVKDAIGLNSDTAGSLGFALQNEPAILLEEAESIRQSGRYRLLHHFSWRQPGLAEDSARAIRINVGRTMKVDIPEDYKQFDTFIPATRVGLSGAGARSLTTTTVSGTLKITLGRFLHMHALLAYTDDESGISYRMDHSRKMRSRELHYIDNPRFGLLTKIVPLE